MSSPAAGDAAWEALPIPAVELDVQGAVLRANSDDNAELYGKKLENRDIIGSNMPAPPDARPLIATLQRYSTSTDADRVKH